MFIEIKCKEIIGNLFYVKIKYFFDNLFCILKEIDLFGWGLFVNVFFCDVDIGGVKL